MSKATNHAGWGVYALGRTGWSQQTKPMTQEAAQTAMEQWPIKGLELRVYEVLEAAPLTLLQQINAPMKAFKAFWQRTATRYRNATSEGRDD